MDLSFDSNLWARLRLQTHRNTHGQQWFHLAARTSDRAAHIIHAHTQTKINFSSMRNFASQTHAWMYDVCVSAAPCGLVWRMDMCVVCWALGICNLHFYDPMSVCLPVHFRLVIARFQFIIFVITTTIFKVPVSRCGENTEETKTRILFSARSIRVQFIFCSFLSLIFSCSFSPARFDRATVLLRNSLHTTFSR